MASKQDGFVLNDFLRFERKVYSVFGIKIGRAISFRTLLYFSGFTGGLILLHMIPGVGEILNLVHWLYQLAAVWGIAYILTDVGTENRSPISFFRSMYRHFVLLSTKESFYKGKVIREQKPIRFTKLPSVALEPKKEEPKPKGIKVQGGFSIR